MPTSAIYYRQHRDKALDSQETFIDQAARIRSILERHGFHESDMACVLHDYLFPPLEQGADELRDSQRRYRSCACRTRRTS